ncbi:hypothetical protein Lepto7376_2291 [[Leptolyngbya] sp. PCC 7376]|uniref:PilW family protein n=1 Tax=[Leptolyngbya] sp. PCC 7376 TaxID=111781 RepID=UPI00029F043D|nr:prepilin-type N-terminal cleavage/methylation domain-containing protein [[Leptolyngbya] sp. PCC 7376]AFY38581.1 hypothetical protein Lepto7376_2291 [[Leptolyngbya] sp. PCC 7376]
MKRQFIQWKPSTQISNKLSFYLKLLDYQRKTKNNSSELGFTLVELLVSLAIGLLVISLAFFGSVLNRQIFVQDRARSEIAQTLRLPLDTVGNDIKQAGEGIGTSDPNFPVVLLTQNPTQLTIRRQLVPTSIPVCRDIAVGSSDPVVVLDQNGGTPLVGCEITVLSDADSDGWPDQWDNAEKFRDYRLNNGSAIRAFIYNGNGEGEFFDYQNERAFDIDDNEIPNPLATVNPVEYTTLDSNSNVWTNNYLGDSSSRIYLLEERRYQLDETSNTLQLITDNSQTLSITNNIDILEVAVIVEQDNVEHTCTVLPPTTATDCDPVLTNSYSWSQIKAIDVMLQVAADSSPALALQENCPDPNDCEALQLRRQFVPRNVFNF